MVEKNMILRWLDHYILKKFLQSAENYLIMMDVMMDKT